MKLAIITLVAILAFTSASCQSKNTNNMTKNNNTMLCDLETGMCEMPADKSDTTLTSDIHAEKKQVKIIYYTDPICSSWIIRSKLTPSPVKIRKDFPFNWKILNAIPADVDPLYCLKRK